jgi:LuxR family maltose regulon positive regulatory protein
MALREGTSVPPLHRRHVRRPRLTRLLEASSAQAILVTAPPGYGKTLLTCEWLEGRADVAWYRATPASADLAAFSIGIVDAMAHVVPGAGERLRQRLVVGEPPDRAARPMAELLAEDLANWPAGARLVIDDYHLVSDSAPVEEFMDWLLTLASGLKVLVTSRRRPAWASARRFLHGEIFELTTPQLAMSDAEAAVLLDGRSGESVRRLVTQAQGWPALIALAALSASAEIPDELVIDRLYRYFAEEVVRTQSPTLQRLMLLAAVPSTLNADIARELLGSPDPEVLIARLEDDGLLQPTGPSDHAFHPLLRDFLRRKLEHDAPDDFADLAQRVISHAREHRRWEEAFELAAYCNDIDAAVELLAEAAEDLLPAGQIETLEAWLAACGPAATRVPARLVRAQVLSRQGRSGEALGLALDTGRRLEPNSPYFSRLWTLAGQAANLLSRPESSLEFHLRALSAASAQDEVSSALWGIIVASAELETDQLDDYIRRFEDAAPEDTTTQLRAVIGRGWSARLRRDLADVWPLIQSTLPLVPHADPSAASLFVLWAGYVACLRADYQAGRSLAEQAEAICRQFRLDFALRDSQMVRAQAAFGLRDLRSMRETVPLLAESARASGDPFLDAAAALLAARLGIAEGQLQRAQDALSRPLVATPTSNMRGEILATAALIEASLGQPELAEAHAREAMAVTASAEAHYISLFARLIIAASRDSREHATIEDEATVLLNEADRCGLLDAAVLAYRAQPQLLATFAGDERTRGIIHRLCRRANDEKFALRVGVDVRGRNDFVGGPLALLTKREAEVLSLMCEGLANSEIAQRLFIAESTAKVHVRHILAKFGLRSRLQVVLAARSTIDQENGAP